jgi:alpha-tubulin suppressor-like RCC1 family protein
MPSPVQGFESGVTSIVAGWSHACALHNGLAYCWGYNHFGQLGNNSTSDSAVPVPVQGLESRVTAMAAGSYHTCALANASAYCWGLNSYGQLGNNSTVNSAVPVPVLGLSSGVTGIAAGTYHTCALVNGNAYCWGDNSSGELGNESTTSTGPPLVSNSAVPVAVENLSSGVTAIAAGDGHTCALIDGSAYCWGLNLWGQLGNNSTANSRVPVQVIFP